MTLAKKAAMFGAGLVAVIVFFVVLSRRATAEDAPWIPESDGVILERLPAGRGDARERALSEMRRALEKNPNDLRLAVRVARENVELSRARSDPRYLGHAEAALAPWYALERPPHAVTILRATIRQSNHDFDGALADLAIALAEKPDDVQAWLTKATVLTVRAEYADARASCENVRRLASPLVSATCFAAIDAMTGHAGEAFGALEKAILEAESSPPEERAWAQSALGEVALRRGDPGAAETQFEIVLRVTPGDAYVIGALCDLYFDTGRYALAIPLVKDKTENDALLLRLVIAEAMTGAPSAKNDAAMLRARYDASRARGDTVHRREQARFALLESDLADAVKLASANWRVQKEAADARILLEVAKATGDHAAAAPVVKWLDDNHVEDPKLRALAGGVR